MDDEVLLTRREGGILTLTLNRPHRKNALDAALWEALHTQLGAVRRDPDVRAVVITGAGGDFCAGADLSGAREGHPLDRMRFVNDVALLLHELPVPTVAAVDGVAVGAGWNLALGCDLVVATPRSRFSQIFAKRGLSLDFGGSWLLPRLVGMQQAKRLALLAEMIDVDEALRLGLVTWVVPVEEIEAYAAELAGRLAAMAPVAVSQSKALLHENADRPLRDALASEARAQSVNFATEDAPEAFAAFNEKRDATFTGRWAVR
ncbi:enoyl-CoA hydratase/isomerase family protein [Actinomycetospora lemnae]|uniref:Enoyl-CoA hydratase-related protein n=1 Tax=Actinomycetospora lemnae TaxID=3019891 RepID=A0ABT5SXF3_9PSEU|nr:enoyl-CoA hydratase-related protein [Actinomycetospora sp. DW7H6]MDD7967160.1 enoyl-CoA hydratase-related protein [Actinomycetospora sp. DW7H6]